MTRSLPEKTFEHWCSIHLTYRYRAKLRMWWPSRGADIRIEQSKVVLGKRFWLELKTTEWDSKAGTHKLQLDLDQLDRYGNQPVPDYYVFPQPAWIGVLGKNPSATWLGSLHRSDLGYESHSLDQWFARWTWVVSGHHLRQILSKQISRYRRGKRKETMTVARTDGRTLTPTKGVKGLNEILWHEFWQKMETCGDDGMPAQFLLPRSRTSSSGTTNGPSSRDGDTGRDPRSHSVSRQELVSALSELDEDIEPAADVADVYSPTGYEGEYAITPDAEALSLEGFAWNDETARGLMSLTPQALNV